MVSFSCEVCNDTMTKKKLDQHRQRCYDAYFTCIDCSVTFVGTDYRNHTQCISEAEKYEKSLYKGKPSKQNGKATAAQTKGNKQVTKKEEDNSAASKSIKSTTENATEDVKKSSSNKEKSKKNKKTAKTSTVDLTKYAGGSLSKVLKSISKDTKTDKKDLMKKLHLELVDGKVVLKL
ncbi:hypothetical protein JCM33374_g5256 [Metschnikowia sp. JCM 33374]|nr:hypothetical protein JCM33374_g5256 [Metschnikowia sp. JCM 33374]